MVDFRTGRAWALATAAGVVVASRLLDARIAAGPVLCPFRWVSGFPCPGCGLTRAFVALAHGDVAAALAFNAFSLPLFAATIVAIPWLALELARGRALGLGRWAYSRRLALGLALALVTYDVARIVWWAQDGTLVAEYLSRAWWYRLADAWVATS